MKAITGLMALTVAGLGTSGINAQFSTFGTGCAGSRGVPTLTAQSSQVPQPGRPFTVNVRNLPRAASAFLLLGHGGGAPGLDLGIIGMPGCKLYTSGELLMPVTNVLGTGLSTISLPNDPSLVLYLQAAVSDPGVNQLGLTASNGARLSFEPAATTFVHTATAGDTFYNHTYLDDERINGDPNALLLVTQNWNPGSDKIDPRGTPDQKNDPSATTSFSGIGPGGSLFQSFTARASSLRAVELRLRAGGLFPSSPVRTELLVRAGTPDGAIVARSTVQVSGLGVGEQTLARFTFSANTLRAGSTYVLEWKTLSPTILSWMGRRDNPYAGGKMFGPTKIPATNYDLNFLTFGPARGAGAYNPHSVGVWYDNSRQQWSVFNEDRTTLPTGVSFNILVHGRGDTRFVHKATTNNISRHRTILNHPALNRNPNARVLVTQNWNPGGQGGTYNDAVIGVFYNSGSNRWEIFNQGFEPMPLSASFNVLVTDAKCPAAFTHTAISTTIRNNWTLLDHPALNGDPDAVFQVTQNWNPLRVRGVYNNHVTGVWYYRAAGKWAIFQQDRSAMVNGASFNILVGEGCGR